MSWLDMFISIFAYTVAGIGISCLFAILFAMLIIEHRGKEQYLIVITEEKKFVSCRFVKGKEKALRKAVLMISGSLNLEATVYYWEKKERRVKLVEERFPSFMDKVKYVLRSEESV